MVVEPTITFMGSTSVSLHSFLSINPNLDIRITKRTKWKRITTIEGIPPIFNYPKILKALKRKTKANGAVKKSKATGETII